jgi:hypothetical protein
MQGKDEKSIQNFSRKPLKKRNHLGDLGVDGKMVPKFIVTRYDMKMLTRFNCMKI